MGKGEIREPIKLHHEKNFKNKNQSYTNHHLCHSVIKQAQDIGFYLNIFNYKEFLNILYTKKYAKTIITYAISMYIHKSILQKSKRNLYFPH